MSSGVNVWSHDIEARFFVACFNETCDAYGNEYLTEEISTACYHDGKHDEEGNSSFKWTCPECGDGYETDTRENVRCR